MTKFYKILGIGLCSFFLILVNIASADQVIVKKQLNSMNDFNQQDVENFVIKETSYQIDGIEEYDYGNQGETTFCTNINRSDYKLGDHMIEINGKVTCPPSKIKIQKISNPFSPYKIPEVKLVLRIRFDDKDNTYADTLYIGDDNNLYSCHGGK